VSTDAGPLPPTRCAVVGSPIAHSLSPVLHRAAYAHLGLDWVYERHEIAESGLRAFVDGLDGSWRGLSLTMPLKHEAVRLATEVSDLARRVGAANTLVFDGPRRFADNTDVPGLAAALRERGVERVEHATVLGGGATAASAVAALAGIAGRVEVVVREPARAAGVARVADAAGLACTLVPWTDAPAALRAPLVVATTPKGAADGLAASVPPGPGVLFDVLYDPWPTPLAAAWTAAGGRVLGGLDLLVHQAVLQVELMTGAQVPVAVLRAALGERGAVGGPA
jgi:shikimate dehydrogenase